MTRQAMAIVGTPIEWELPVDENNKATVFNPFKGGINCGRRRKTNPHMRAFWAATLTFCFAFIGWFAFAPLMTVVRVDIGICDNDAALKLLPEDKRVKACKCGKSCKAIVGNADIASVSFDVATRVLMGAVIERAGPRLTDCILLAWGAIVVACSAAVVDAPGLIAARFFVSCLGCTFVINQFWNSIMFNPSIVGTANATGGGWGNLGGGITQLLMPLIYRFWNEAVGLNLSWSWRATMFFPAFLYLCLLPFVFFCSHDTPLGKFDVAVLGKTQKASPMTYVRCIMDYRVFLMIWQYSACFGCGLVMNNILASHFHDAFGVDLVAAGALAMGFGGMDLFARSFGGMLSDWCNLHWQMRGRLWAHFSVLVGQAIFLFGMGMITDANGGWPVFLTLLVIFACFLNAAEGTSYAIVPYMIPSELPVVSALVGAGGTLGAVISLWSFYKQFDNFTSMKLHAAYVIFWALTVPLMRWDHMGSMFGGPRVQQRPSEEAKGAEEKKGAEDSSHEVSL